MTSERILKRRKYWQRRYDVRSTAMGEAMLRAALQTAADTIDELCEVVDQLIACHDEPTCPAVAVGKELLQCIQEN